MELRYVLITLLKILISTPTVLLLYDFPGSEGAALMGGHLDNKKSNVTNVTDNYYEYDLVDSQELEEKDMSDASEKESADSEEIPNPSPLVLPGYNLPENIFNKGKPFYVEKDPLTGKIDFTHKSPSVKLDEDLYDYVDEEPSDNIYDKANINRKDGESTNMMNTGMAQLGFNEEFDYYDSTSTSTEKPKSNDIYLTTENVKNIYLTSKAPSTTTKKVMSLFEQLFGDYDETPVTTQKPKPTEVVDNLKSDEYKTEKEELSDEKSSHSTPTTPSVNLQYPNAHAGPNILTGSSMGLDTVYDYDDYGKYEDNVAVESRPIKNIDDELKIEPLDVFKEEKQAFNITGLFNVNDKDKPMHNFDESLNNTDYTEYDYQEKEVTLTSTTSTTTTTTTTTSRPSLYNNVTSLYTNIITTTTVAPMRVTSLPLGENHVTNLNYEPFNREPIIVATQNLREKLNSEKVIPKPFEKPSVHFHTQPPSTSNIHIAPDQDTVSFVVGDQQNVDGGQYIGTSLKESPYDSNPFRPLYGQQGTYENVDTLRYPVQPEPEVTLQPQSRPHLVQTYPEVVGSAVTIQPMKNSEASLAIGVPINSVKQIPGQVVDEKLEVDDHPIEPPKSSGSKVVFPDEKESEFPDLVPPPRSPQPIQPPPPNREVLKLSSKPVYHQLPSDLTPPKHKDVISPPRLDHRPMRPPWDPRPGHFFTGKPEYNRPLRPPPELAYKRIDNLPNILPQFRPNMNKHNAPLGHFYDHRLTRQPLLERPSNRPIGYMEKLQPPPPPPPHPAYKNLQNLRKIPPPANPPRQSLDDTQIAEDRIINEGPRRPAQTQNQYAFFQTPPPLKIANRRNGDDAVEIETLQMIQAKNTKKVEKPEKEPSTNAQVLNTPGVVNVPAVETFENTEKTVYKVYPVNTQPIKLDALDSDKKESVVIGTRAELPLPPSKINKDFAYESNPLFDTKDRNDAPILKPHPRPLTFPIKSDFPYPMERPDPSVIHPAVPETPANSGNSLDETGNSYTDETNYFATDQWNANIESRIINKQKTNSANQISVTLKTFTEKPIAVAYTPTEPNLNADKYSMPNYGSPVIPEIRPGTVENAETGHGSSNSEFTVSAVMHTHPQLILGNRKTSPNEANKRVGESNHNFNHKIDMETPDYPKLDFQAPFQASVNLDQSMNQGWSVVRDKNKTTTETMELTTLSYATTSEFDIENFKPQLEGGFKPIYNFPDEKKNSEAKVSEREE
ncbi:hypothetical protein NQ318_002395 [Aromia moschata]|uniref:Uncharacterized protein n=1 Tax=Aromia moschata TaxID=1265417 RepID=A0AAV8YHM4_9CUCU|nr:hypothetical protein NQ318_002395 [Aromia moschata]